MKEPTSIKELIQSLTGGDVSLIIGQVTKVSPLEIMNIGDEKHIISEEILIVPEHLKDHEVEIEIDDFWTEKYPEPEEEPGHKHKVKLHKKAKVYGKLKKGDEVALLALAHGKHYYVLDRM